MSMKNLLRPPLEYTTVIACLFFSCFVIDNTAIRGLLLIFAAWRWYQVWQLIAYQERLRTIKPYQISSQHLPQTANGIFLGKGFSWQALQTQRLYDLKQVKNQRYLPNNMSDQDGNICLHSIGDHDANLFLENNDRVGHTMILGTTRVGKTRLLEILISGDIKRNDSAVIVFDPKGDTDLLRRIYYEAKQVKREHDLLIFHLGYPNDSARYNPIGQFARSSEVANRVANQLPSSGESAAFREFAWRFVNIITNTLIALGRRPTYHDLNRYILNIDPLFKEYCQHWLATVNPAWQQIVQEKANLLQENKLPSHLKHRDKWLIALIDYVDGLGLENSIFDGLKAMFNYDQTYFQKITASLSPLFAKLSSGKIAELISPDYTDTDDERPIFNWLQVIRSKKIVYIGLDALSDSTVATAVGNSMFADLCSTVGQIYKYGVEDDITNPQAKKCIYPINVYSDEFNELAGDEFIPLANKGGGAGLQLTVATQTAADVIARLGQTAKAQQIFGNFNQLICLRVLDTATAKLLCDKLPQHVTIKDTMPASSSNDNTGLNNQGDFSSQNEDRIINRDIPLLSPEDVMQLPKGQAFCLLTGNQLWKVRFPLAKDDLSEIPETVDQIISKLNHDQATN